MSLSFYTRAGSLLCCEEAFGCFPDEGEQDREGELYAFCDSSWPGPAMELEEAAAAVAVLIEREIFHMPEPDYAERYESKVLDSGCRQQAIDWLFKVRAFYNFGSLTAALSVNYLDRFLSHGKFLTGKAWMVQLLSVACLSLAAKMEEVDVPLLLDLQVGPECCFEPRTIQRMELLVLSTLDWRMSSVTPFSYLDYFVSKFGFGGSSYRLVLSRINELILLAVRELRFLRCRPAAIAAAASLCAIQELLPPQLIKLKKYLFSVLPEHLKDASHRCFMMMVEIVSPLSRMPSKDDICAHSAPGSPSRVLDASFSCESVSTFKSIALEPSLQVSSPAPKRRKVDDYCRSMNMCAS